MTDQPVIIARRSVRGSVEPFTYELELRVEGDRSLARYTIHGAEPTNLQLQTGGFRGVQKYIRLRIDSEEPILTQWWAREFRNVGELFTFDVKALAGAQSRVAIQGLRDSTEYVEFPIDESFEPFRKHLKALVTDDARKAAAENERRAAEAEAERERINAQAEDRAIAEQFWMGTWKQDFAGSPIVTIDEKRQATILVNSGGCVGGMRINDIGVPTGFNQYPHKVTHVDDDGYAGIFADYLSPVLRMTAQRDDDSLWIEFGGTPKLSADRVPVDHVERCHVNGVYRRVTDGGEMVTEQTASAQRQMSSAELVPVRLSETGLKPPQKIRDVPPVYPAIAQSARVQGVVHVEATIGLDGKVTNARVVRSIPLLDAAAFDAVRQWEFTPTLVDGVAVPVIMTVTVEFSLQ